MGESVGVFSDLLTDKSIVRTQVEYVTLVLYSFCAPILIILIMINMVLGIVADAFGAEKDNLRGRGLHSSTFQLNLSRF